jgi:hypothetical protein
LNTYTKRQIKLENEGKMTDFRRFFTSEPTDQMAKIAENFVP